MVELRKGFHSQLDDVRQSLIRLAASVIEAVPRATNVLLSGDLEGAEYIILTDDEIDARSIELEDKCYQLLALQAPVAGELRQLVAILKMIGEIERADHGAGAGEEKVHRVREPYPADPRGGRSAGVDREIRS